MCTCTCAGRPRHGCMQLALAVIWIPIAMRSLLDHSFIEYWVPCFGGCCSELRNRLPANACRHASVVRAVAAQAPTPHATTKPMVEPATEPTVEPATQSALPYVWLLERPACSAHLLKSWPAALAGPPHGLPGRALPSFSSSCVPCMASGGALASNCSQPAALDSGQSGPPWITACTHTHATKTSTHACTHACIPTHAHARMLERVCMAWHKGMAQHGGMIAWLLLPLSLCSSHMPYRWGTGNEHPAHAACVL